jgi:hypothetical protein
LQAVAGQYPEAVQSFVALRDFRRSAHVSNAAWRDLQFEIYARAKAAASAQTLPFDEAYKQAFRAVFGQLDDPTSAAAMPLFNVADESWANPALQSDLGAQKGKSSIALDAAVALVSDYEAVQAYRASASLRSALIADGTRRFYLSATSSDHAYGFRDQKDAHDGTIDLRVDLADRSDADRKVPGGGVLDTEVDRWNGIEFFGNR